MHYFDPLKKFLYVESLLICLFQYLRSELLLHESKALEQTEWKDVFYRGSAETSLFPKEESLIYVLSHAESYVKGTPDLLKPEDLFKFRERVFLKLVAGWSSRRA